MTRPLEHLLKTGETPTIEEAKIYGAVGNHGDLCTINATNIDDAWFQLIKNIYHFGNIMATTKGSFSNQKLRKQLMHVNGIIRFPWTRPLLPTIPPGMSISPPVDDEFLNQYLLKLFDPSSRTPNEEYTYADDLAIQIPKVIRNFLKSGFASNQEYMTVGGQSTVDMEDPQCLRGVDVKVINRRMHFILYFRSWDAWSGFPANMAGLQLVKEDMVYQLNEHKLKVEDGPIIFNSAGAHLYDYSWEPARIRLGISK